MPTKQQVLEALEGTADYERAGDRLDIPPGRAYLIATGVPADGSTPGQGLGARAQALVNSREVNPTSRGDVQAWMRKLAHSDASMRDVGASVAGAGASRRDASTGSTGRKRATTAKTTASKSAKGGKTPKAAGQ